MFVRLGPQRMSAVRGDDERFRVQYEKTLKKKGVYVKGNMRPDPRRPPLAPGRRKGEGIFIDRRIPIHYKEKFC